MTLKLLSILASLIITNIAYFFLAYFMLTLIKSGSFNFNTYLFITFTLFIIQLIFFSLGLLISLVLPGIKSVISISLATVFGFFILDLFNTIIDDIILRYFTPYKYFDSIYIMKNISYETPFVIVSILIILSAITASYFIYAKKDFLI